MVASGSGISKRSGGRQWDRGAGASALVYQQSFVCQAQHGKNQQAQQNVAGGAKQICCSVCARVKIAWWRSAWAVAVLQPAMCAEVACVSRMVRAVEASMPLSMPRACRQGNLCW